MKSSTVSEPTGTEANFSLDSEIPSPRRSGSRPVYPRSRSDGELWLERKQFQKTVSIVRRKDQTDLWKQVRYVVFDVPTLAEPFEARIAHLQSLIREHSPPFALAHDHRRCLGIAHLKEELQRVEAPGGEGLMLRQPSSIYVAGRSSTLLKVKTFQDAEA